MCVCGCSRACDQVYVRVFACSCVRVYFSPFAFTHWCTHTDVCVGGGSRACEKNMYVCVCVHSSRFFALAQHFTRVRVGVCVYASVWKGKGACVCMLMHDSVKINLHHEIRKRISAYKSPRSEVVSRYIQVCHEQTWWFVIWYLYMSELVFWYMYVYMYIRQIYHSTHIYHSACRQVCSWQIPECIMSRMWMCHVARVNEPCHTSEWGVLHVWMRHVTRANESCHTCVWVMWRI